MKILVALAISIELVGPLAARRTKGWRLSAWSAVVAAVMVGLAYIALPDVPGSVGQAYGALAVAWGVLFVAVTESEVGRANGSRIAVPLPTTY